jgi:hypothetical protein
MFENILLNNPDITVRLDVDYFAVKVPPSVTFRRGTLA